MRRHNKYQHLVGNIGLGMHQTRSPKNKMTLRTSTIPSSLHPYTPYISFRRMKPTSHQYIPLVPSHPMPFHILIRPIYPMHEIRNIIHVICTMHLHHPIILPFPILKQKRIIVTRKKNIKKNTSMNRGSCQSPPRSAKIPQNTQKAIYMRKARYTEGGKSKIHQSRRQKTIFIPNTII